MAVAIVRTGASPLANWTTSGAFTSDSLTFDATSCNYLVVVIETQKSGAQPTSFTATYNGVSMSPIAGSPFGPDTTFGFDKVAVFVLANPTSGSHTLATSWTNSAGRYAVGVFGFSGAGAISSIQSSLNGSNFTVTSTTNSLIVAAGLTASANGSALSISPITAYAFQFLWGAPNNAAGSAGYMPGVASQLVTMASGGSAEMRVGFSVDVPTSTQFNQTITVTCTTTTVTIKSVVKLMAVSCTSTTAVLKRVAKIVPVACTTAMAFTKLVGKKIASIALTTTTSLSKTVGKIVSASSVTTTAVQARKTINVVIAVACTTAVSQTKRVAKTIAVACTTAVSQTKLIAKSVSTALTTSTSMTKLVGKTVSTQLTTTVSLVAHFIFRRRAVTLNIFRRK